MNNIRLTKKNDDGSYDDGELLFKTIDLYGGDHQTRTLEIAPGVNVQEVKYVYFGIALNDTNGKIAFTPEKEGSHLLTNSAYKNIKFYLEHKSGYKFYPDKNGLIKITDLLIKPMDVVIHVIAEKYTANRLTEENVFDEIEIEVSGA
ncbi:MAG: hypothetical protein ACRC0G_04470 [Fusobacteriaceae bacterium]